MTISYESDSVATTLKFWRGSLLYNMWRPVLIWLVIYYVISLIYRFGLSGDAKHTFELLVVECNGYLSLIPLSFLLGFYVSAVYNRYFAQLDCISMPDVVLTYIWMMFPKNDAETVAKRRTIARWLSLTQALVWREISLPVRQRFPTIDYVVKMGLMTESERRAYNQIETMEAKSVLPLMWLQRLVAYQIDNHPVKTTTSGMMWHTMTNLGIFRKNCYDLYKYGFFLLPLEYTQVVAVAVYGYFALAAVARQYLLDDAPENVRLLDIYVPVFTILQMVFFIGWYKVGLMLSNPFGDDPDDVETTWFFDRNLAVGFSIMDECREHQVNPVDTFKGEMQPRMLYTKAMVSEAHHKPKLLVPVDLNDANIHEYDVIKPEYEANPDWKFF